MSVASTILNRDLKEFLLQVYYYHEDKFVQESCVLSEFFSLYVLNVQYYSNKYHAFGRMNSTHNRKLFF